MKLGVLESYLLVYLDFESLGMFYQLVYKIFIHITKTERLKFIVKQFSKSTSTSTNAFKTPNVHLTVYQLKHSKGEET